MIFISEQILVMVKKHEFHHSSLGKYLTGIYWALGSSPDKSKSRLKNNI